MFSSLDDELRMPMQRLAERQRRGVENNQAGKRNNKRRRKMRAETTQHYLGWRYRGKRRLQRTTDLARRARSQAALSSEKVNAIHAARLRETLTISGEHHEKWDT